MTLLRPDPTFYPSPSSAASAPAEELAYVVTLNTDGQRPDALVVVDTNPASTTYGTLVGRLDMTESGDELHHFGWNACSSALCPSAPHPHVERRYLVIPGLRSSRIYVADTKPDPKNPKIIKTIEPATLTAKTGYTRPHTVHCGPDGIYVGALGNSEGDGPGGVLRLDHETFEPISAWENDRGGQYLAYDFWWHLNHDVMITSEWGTPKMVEDGLQPSLLGQYGHQIHFWDLRKRNLTQTIDLGAEYQMVLELRPAHNPNSLYGFVGVVVSTADLSASIWVWQKAGSNGAWEAKKVITIPAEPADPELLPPALKPFGAVPPLVTDIDLSVDDKSLYVSCWGTGELQRYDVSDPLNPKKTGSVRLGGIVSKAKHPSGKGGELNGGPQMVEISRDGKRVYLTNSLYRAWDEQFYPEGVRGWIAKLDADANGGMSVDPNFFISFEGERPHQVRLQGGDASSDSYCFP